MIEFLLSILSSVIGNLLTPTVKRRLGVRDEVVPPQMNDLTPGSDEAGLDQHRMYVRQQWAIYSWTAFVFFVLFFFVGGALSLPVFLKTGFFSEALPCANLRIADFCGGSVLAVSDLKWLLFLLTGGFSAIVWGLAQLLADPIADYIHYNHRHVDPVFYRRILALTIMLLAFILCGHWIYFLYPKTGYLEALVLPFIIVGFVGMMSSARR